MSSAAAVAFIDKVEADPIFAEKLKSLGQDFEAVRRTVAEAGFEATPEEIKTVFLTRFGSELTTEQLDMIAGGLDGWGIFFLTLGIAEVVATAAAAI